MVAVLLALVVSQAQDNLPRVAVEVVNSRGAGRKILHFEDAVGPRAKARGRHTPAKAALVVASAIEGCDTCAAHLDKLNAIRGKGGLVVLLILTDESGAPRVREAHALDDTSVVIAVDPHGLAKDRLGLVGPESAVVIRSDGGLIRLKGIDEAIKVFLSELEEDKT